MANQITNLLAESGISLPNVSGSSILKFIGGGLLTLVLSVGIVILGIWIMNKLTYKKEIIIFEKVGQKFEPTGKDKAREFVLGVGGERVLYLKKAKIWKVAEQQASRNTYWFAILDDGYWYNITLGDLNKDLGEFDVTGISPEIHKIMRYQNAGLRKNLADRHLKKKWYEHPLIGWIGAILFVIITGIMFVMIAKEYLVILPETMRLANQLIERINNLIPIVSDLLQSADRVCQQ